MIPRGDDWRILKALGYMAPDKVLRWAQATICPNVNERDIKRIARTLPRPKGFSQAAGDRPDSRSRLATPIGRNDQPRDTGALGRAFDRLIAARAKDCGVSADLFKRQVLGWTVNERFAPRRFG